MIGQRAVARWKRLVKSTGDRSMSYIAALRCPEAIVMCADTQETIEDGEKQYAEKLQIIKDHSYPLAVGGAGLDEPIDALSQEIRERASEVRPTTVKELASLIKSAVAHVYEHDIPVSAYPKQYRTAQLLIGAKPTADDFCIFHVKGKRLYESGKRAIIGYATAPNNALLKRLYRENLSIQQAVILSLFLVSQSKLMNEGVGFDTQVAVVTKAGVWLEPEEDIRDMESRFEKTSTLVNELLLTASDIGITEHKFNNLLEEFKQSIFKIRSEYKVKLAEQINQGINWPYAKLPVGFISYETVNDKGDRTSTGVYAEPEEKNAEKNQGAK